MTLWAIVPVKPLRRGKSRLSGVLTEEERTFLNYSMLGNTLKALSEVKSIEKILVISRDPAALTLAREFGARTVQEDSTSELNLALQRATVVAQLYAAQSVLILPADLPLVTPERIQALIDLASKPPMLVIAPDRRREGTNALLMNPVGLINYAYGPNSFQRHVDQARRYRVRVEICEDPAFGLDLDVPEDLDMLRQMEVNVVQLKP
jgi:2-phospho-L-lactate/phosphoenolpyruvate guanylyltransferase